MPESDFNKVAFNKVCNIIEITIRYACSLVNLLHIFRTPFNKGTSGGLLVITVNSEFHCNVSSCFHQIFHEDLVSVKNSIQIRSKQTDYQTVFSCEFCEISKNNVSTEHLRTTASVRVANNEELSKKHNL